MEKQERPSFVAMTGTKVLWPANVLVRYLSPHVSHLGHTLYIIVAAITFQDIDPPLSDLKVDSLHSTFHSLPIPKPKLTYLYLHVHEIRFLRMITVSQHQSSPGAYPLWPPNLNLSKPWIQIY